MALTQPNADGLRVTSGRVKTTKTEQQPSMWGDASFSKLIERMSASITRQATVIARLETERDAADQRAKQQEDAIDALRRELAGQHLLNAELVRQLELLRTRAMGLQQQAQRWELDAAGALGQLERILGSFSWAMLAPWRAFRRFASRSQQVVLRRQLRGHVDPPWYLKRYPDVKSSELDALGHFIVYGMAERRDPNPAFSTDWYLRSNPDVAAAGVNPLVHFLTWGLGEGRDPHPKVSYADYIERYPVAQP